MWLRRSLSRSFNVRRPSRAASAGTIRDPTEPASRASSSNPAAPTAAGRGTTPRTVSSAATDRPRTGSVAGGRPPRASRARQPRSPATAPRCPTWPGARTSVLEKGGGLTGVAALPSELIDQLAERAVAIAEVLGDVLLRAAVEEHGAEGFVAAVIRMGGPGEELPERGVGHHRCSLGLSV